MKKQTHKNQSIDFERLLSEGHDSYNQEVGTWWNQQAENKAHKIAYKNISLYLKSQLPKSLKKPVIVDYACGTGAFMAELLKVIPNAQVIGLDGSEKMLEIAKHRITKAGISCEIISTKEYGKFTSKQGQFTQVQLLDSVLPNFALPKGKADVGIFLFPNLVCAPEYRDYYDQHGYQDAKDSEVATLLARFREMDPEDEIEPGDPEVLYDDLMTSKVLSRNLRHLVKKGGFLLRTDYANAPREELTSLTQWRTLFAEGALEIPIKGAASKPLFAYKNSLYKKSSVILDVYHQTQDPTDKEGGYYTSFFKAI
jgi:hypothetical protein